MNISAAQSVLVIKPGSLGDVVHTLPAVNLIARRHAGLEIRWIVDSRWAPLLAGHPSLAGLISFPRDSFRGPAGWARFLRWGRTLRGARGRVALDFQGLFRSALMSWMSGVERIVGMSDAREGARFFFDEVVAVDPAAHAVDRYLRLAAAVGAPGDGAPLEYLLPEGMAPPHDEAASLSAGQFVLLHPCARGRGKALGAAQLERFCRAMAPARVVVVGASAGAQRGAGTGALAPNALDLSNATGLLELLWLMRRARFCVSTDSGPMHLAAAVTGRLLGIHTWTDPRLVGPCRGDAWVWKGGVIRRVRELERGDRRLAGDRGSRTAAIGDSDIDAIAAFVSEHI